MHLELTASAQYTTVGTPEEHSFHKLISMRFVRLQILQKTSSKNEPFKWLTKCDNLDTELPASPLWSSNFTRVTVLSFVLGYQRQRTLVAK